MKRIYLAGAIERAPDLGVGWRKDVTPFLEELGFEVIDPCIIEDKGMKLFENELVRRKDLSTPEKLAAYKSTVKHKVIIPDLAMLYSCTHILCLWDKYAQAGAGTAGELTMARWLQKQVWLVNGYDDIAKVSGWILGCADEIFNNFEELPARLL